MATILIIDAAASIANPIAHALRQDGHVSLVALDADKAWLLMQQFQIDILITDRYLPGQSGEALIRRLRSHPRLARLPVIVMSTDAPADLDAIWLTKPLPAKHVQATVEQLLQATIDPRLNGRVS